MIADRRGERSAYRSKYNRGAVFAAAGLRGRRNKVLVMITGEGVWRSLKSRTESVQVDGFGGTPFAVRIRIRV